MYNCLGQLVRPVKKHPCKTPSSVSHSANLPPHFPHAERCRFHILTLPTDAQGEDAQTHPPYQIPAEGSGESSANQPASGSPCWSSQLRQGPHIAPQTQKAARQKPERLRLPTAGIREDKGRFAGLPQIKFLSRGSQTPNQNVLAPITFLHPLNQKQNKYLMSVLPMQCSLLGTELEYHGKAHCMFLFWISKS